MDVGRDRYGVDMPEMGTPEQGIRPTPGAPEEAPVEAAPVENIDAEIDWIFSGDANDRYSRMRQALGAKNDREVVQILRQLYRDTTGSDIRWENGYEAAQDMTPEMLKGLLIQ